MQSTIISVNTQQSTNTTREQRWYKPKGTRSALENLESYYYYICYSGGAREPDRKPSRGGPVKLGVRRPITTASAGR